MFYVSKDWYSCTNPGEAHCWICFIGVSFFWQATTAKKRFVSQSLAIRVRLDIIEHSSCILTVGNIEIKVVDTKVHVPTLI